MRSSRHKIILILFTLFFWPHVVQACKYNVRETGFVDLEKQHYVLNFYYDEYVIPQTRSELQNSAAGILRDSNIEINLVDVAKQNIPQDSILWEQDKPLPQCVLSSPDGQTRPVSIDNLSAELKRLVASPTRDEIIKKSIQHYAVVLLIQGRAESENQRARDIAEAAITHIAKKMDMLPKPIEHPPAIVTIEQNRLAAESVLLWSLGLDAGQISEPHLAIIYGKARWIGPLVSGEHLTKVNLVSLLLIIGADCECGLDKSWLQGTMLPLKWDVSQQKATAKNLGFEAENPYVRMEMTAMMRNSMAYGGVSWPAHAFVDTNETGDTSVEALSQTDSIVDSEEKSVSMNPLLSRSILLVAFFLGFVLICGIILVVYKRRRT